MPDSIQADVIVPVYRDTTMTMRCLESVLVHGEPVLRSLIVVDDASPEANMQDALANLAQVDSRVRVFHNQQNVGFVATCNRGLAGRRGDAVLLNSDTIVTSNWLRELAEVAHLDSRIGCVSPLSNNATFYSVPAFAAETAPNLVDWQVVRATCSGLPRWTEMPTGHGFCLYMRGQVLDLVGDLDPIFSPGYEEENDWVMRAQKMGFVATRANRAFVYHFGSRSFSEKAIQLKQRNGLVLMQRHSHYAHQIGRFHYTLDAQLAAHAVQVESSGKVRVALDLRHLSAIGDGTRTYATGLAHALAALPEIELTLIVRRPDQAVDVPARLVSEERLLTDVEVIHKTTQVFDPADLDLLFRSPAHLVITHLDLIAHRAQVVFSDLEEADRYSATSDLALSSAQMTIAMSEYARREIVAEFGLSVNEVAATPPGIDFDYHNNSAEEVHILHRGLNVPDRFFLAVATDLSREKLRNLSDALTVLRQRWSFPGEPPGLVIVGVQPSIRAAAFGHQDLERLTGVTYLGAVTESQRRALYRSAEALVLASAYEGYGSAILEAMAAGTPVIASPLSSVSEYGGDAVHYADGTSSLALARALEQLAMDDQLREELRHRGPIQAAQFRWERTARLTLAAYRSAVFQPSERSLRARRMLRNVLSASEAGRYSTPTPSELGIRKAWSDLNRAFHIRVRREFDRFPFNPDRRSA